jgi:hypothetical protein
MKRRWLLLLAVASLLAVTAPSQQRRRKEDRPPAPSASGTARGPDLRFTQDGKDLVVHLLIEGPAVRQVVLTDYTIDDGKPGWDEPPIGVDKPRRPPKVALRYLVLVNRDLPGFVDKGLMMVPTPPAVRRQQRQEVIWRLPNYRGWGFRKEDATFTVEASRFEASAEQLRQALPRIKQTVDPWDQKSRGKAGTSAP